MALVDEAVLLVDWLNLSIHLKNLRLSFGADLVSGLMALARRECSERDGHVELTKAHFVGEHLSANVRTAIGKTLIAELHETRTAKEQADLQLAVLAMDHLHSASGCPRLFFLATGDQDFVPLIERIVGEKAHVVLLVASTAKLAPEYRYVAAQPNVSLISLADSLNLGPLPTSSGDRTPSGVLSLLRLCMEGKVLGGDQTTNVSLMSRWGQLSESGNEEVEFEGLLQQFTRVDPRKVAVPGTRETGNRSVFARRTSLNFSLSSVSETVRGADWLLRRTANPSRLPTLGELSSGPFALDNSESLGLLIDSMKSLGWLVERPDGTFEATLPHATDGLLEPIWRVACETNRLAFEERADGVPRDHLFNALRSTPIAQDGERRGGRAASDAIAFARRLGVVDAIPHGTDGYLLSVIRPHPLAREVSDFLANIVKIFAQDLSLSLPEHEVLAQMRSRDDQSGRAVFGHDTKDRQRVLRLLRRSGLLGRGGDPDHLLGLKNSAWTRSLIPFQAR
jgi:hypothetical protein